VLEYLGKVGANHLWRCECLCGASRVVRQGNLHSGHTQSCGCLAKEINRARRLTHGKTKSRTYRTWQHMRERCHDESCKSYKDYGGRGIAVCARWRESFEAFLADMGEAPDGCSIERIDNSSGYEPANCRWATRLEQARNKRNTRLVTAHGRTQCASAWAAEAGIDPDTLYWRLDHGFPPEVAIRSGSLRGVGRHE